MNSAELGVKKILISSKEIGEKVAEMGKVISKEYSGKKLLLICILKGSFVFMADLMREITLPCEVDFMCVSSYNNGMESSGKVTITKDLKVDIAGFDVLIVEDIIDSGLTLKVLSEMLLERNPNSLKICTLLDKPARRSAEISADFSCFTIPDEYVIGYGLDSAEKFRNLPYIGVFDTDYKLN
ncbi:MAG: hypoxanthine phosphoribosyltransferase [Oscillospiraceae bacterium]